MATVVVVDDDPDILHLIESALVQVGHEVLAAPDAPSARELIDRQRPDLIVADHMMPGMTGLQFARQLRAEPALATIPIIMLTAAGDHHKDLSVVDRWLSKPFSPRKLADHAERLLRRTRG